ncbi:unnamed protein product [Cochlearia groenlandica]
MRGSISPGSAAHDRSIIRPTWMVQAQVEQPQPTPYNNQRDQADRSQTGPSQTQGGMGEDAEPRLYYTLPPDA